MKMQNHNYEGLDLAFVSMTAWMFGPDSSAEHQAPLACRHGAKGHRQGGCGNSGCGQDAQAHAPERLPCSHHSAGAPAPYAAAQGYYLKVLFPCFYSGCAQLSSSEPCAIMQMAVEDGQMQANVHITPMRASRALALRYLATKFSTDTENIAVQSCWSLCCFFLECREAAVLMSSHLSPSNQRWGKRHLHHPQQHASVHN